jgi:YD repeat-containing protein
VAIARCRRIPHAYDSLNRLSTDAFAGPTTPAQTTTVSYDQYGNLARQTHANGDATFTSYDLANEATSGECDR